MKLFQKQQDNRSGQSLEELLAQIEEDVRCRALCQIADNPGKSGGFALVLFMESGLTIVEAKPTGLLTKMMGRQPDQEISSLPMSDITSVEMPPVRSGLRGLLAGPTVKVKLTTRQGELWIECDKAGRSCFEGFAQDLAASR